MDQTSDSLPGEPVSSRPVMPADYGIDRNARDNMLPWSYVDDQMSAARNYWVATTRPDGRPHVIPVWGVWFDERFYFSTDPSSRKGRNFAANPNVAVHLESGDDVVIHEGVLERVTDRPALDRFVKEYDAKYQIAVDVDNPAYGVYRLQPRVVFAWREQDFPGSATRWVLGAG